MEIWLVDDNPFYSKVLNKLVLSLTEHRIVQMLNSGVELIEQLKSGTPSETTLPDVILLDLYMENMNGWEALDIMKNENFSIPVIIVSNSDSKSDLEKSTSYPAVKGYFKKGDYPAALIDLINSMESTT